MRRWLVRTSVLVAACVLAAYAAASESGSHPSIRLSSARLSSACTGSSLSAQQLDALALRTAASDGDPNATDMQAVASTRALASFAIDPREAPLGSIKDHPHESVFAITMHGSFTDRNMSTYDDSTHVKLNEIALIVDSRTGKGTDAWWGSNAQLRDNPIDLSKLGHVIQLPSRSVASAAVRHAARALSAAKMRHELPCHGRS
jgi:hypothetical protein